MSNKVKYDFGGWATRNNIKCSDGRTILKNAFAQQDGETVPIVWMHNHSDSDAVLGKAVLENRKDGVYAYGSFNDTPQGQNAKKLVDHGDVTSLSIYANHLKQDSAKNVSHGEIKEVSLVLAGANPGAHIEYTEIEHSDGWTTDETEAEIYMDQPLEFKDLEDSLSHVDKKVKDDMENKENNDDKTVQDVIDSMTDEQKDVMYSLVGEALEYDGDDDYDDDEYDDEDDDDDDDEDDEEEYEEDMKHNAFETDAPLDSETTLSHDDFAELIKYGKSAGSLKEGYEEFKANYESTLSHADDGTTYGITNLDYLFPDARAITNSPEFIQRNQDWVNSFFNSSRKTPFARIKTLNADITADEARAKGYTKGKLKKEEVFVLLKRVTNPTTVYKKQKLDRDDVVDITGIDVLTFVKAEMRLMLNEEIARAALLGDGRAADSDDKIKEDCIRPIYKDADLYSVKVEIASTNYSDIIDDMLRARKKYKGSGNPTLYTTEDVLSEMVLLKDTTGRRIYNTEQELATALRVKEIMTVEPMENEKDLIGIMVNPIDYTFGSDKGGETNFFDDFDLDYNQMKFLYESRCSGALVKPYSALVFKRPASTVTPGDGK